MWAVTLPSMRFLRCLAAAVPLLAAAACGGDGGDSPPDGGGQPPSDAVFRVSGTVSGLSGKSVSLELAFMHTPAAPEVVETKMVGDGLYAFARDVPAGAIVRVIALPVEVDLDCRVPPSAGGSLSTHLTADVRADVVVDVDCQPGHDLHIEVIEPPQPDGAGVAVVADGLYMGAATFERGARYILTGSLHGAARARTSLRAGTEYNVTTTHPACMVINGSGIMPAQDVTNIVLDCRPAVAKSWRFDTAETLDSPTPLAGGTATNEEIYRNYTHETLSGPAMGIGALLGKAGEDLFVNLLDLPKANAAVYSNASGSTYWIATEAPGIGPETVTTIETRFGVRRESPAEPTFSLTLSAVQLAGDMAPGLMFPRPYVRATAEMEVRAHRIDTDPDGKDVVNPVPFHFRSDQLVLEGRMAFGGGRYWTLEVHIEPGSFQPNFKRSEFMLYLRQPAPTRDINEVGHAVLMKPLLLPVNLLALPEGERALIVVRSRVRTHNRFNGESLAVAYLRDPALFDPGRQDQSVAVTGISGLSLFAPPPLPGDFVVQTDTAPAPACNAADAPRAQLQFGAPQYSVDEDDPGQRVVTVTRSGSTQGDVSARLRMNAVTAQTGADFVARELMVRFGDGDASPRSVHVQPVDDELLEGPETLTLSLDQPGGCADIGAQGSATVTIADDDVSPSTPPSGTLDESFGNGGRVASYGTGGPPVAMALQGDGRIVMAGGSTADFVLARYLSGGGLDTSFGNGGVVTTDIAGGFQQEQARAVLVQPDGKIVVAGEARPGGGGMPLVVALVRYNADGSLDTGFGNGGKVFDAAHPGRIHAMALQADGKIVVAGDAPVASNPNDFADLLVARYDASGNLDPSFGTGGRVVTDVVGGNDLARNLLILPDGRIVVSGMETGLVGSEPTLVMQLLPDGQPDPTFGTQGKLRLAGPLLGWALARQADGQLLLAGSTDFGPTARVAVMRLAPDGRADAGFGSVGLAVHPFASADTDIAHALVVQADGRIVVAGRTSSGNRNMAALRLLPDGSLDTAFAAGGQLAIDFTGFPDSVERALLQPDGKLLLGGWSRAAGNVVGYALARVQP